MLSVLCTLYLAPDPLTSTEIRTGGTSLAVVNTESLKTGKITLRNTQNVAEFWGAQTLGIWLEEAEAKRKVKRKSQKYRKRRSR